MSRLAWMAAAVLIGGGTTSCDAGGSVEPPGDAGTEAKPQVDAAEEPSVDGDSSDSSGDTGDDDDTGADADASTPATCGHVGYPRMIAYSWTPESNKSWITSFAIEMVRGQINADDATLASLVTRYGGNLKIAPNIYTSKCANCDVAGWVDSIVDLAAEWGQKSVNSLPGLEVVEVNIDDWIGRYRYPIGWNETTGDFDPVLAATNMERIINALKTENPNVLFGVTVYEVDLDPAPHNAFFRRYRATPQACVDCTCSACGENAGCSECASSPYGPRLNRNYDCTECPSCVVEHEPLQVSPAILDRVDVVHLYFHRRRNAPTVVDTVARVKEAFPNAEVVVGVRLWGWDFSRRYDRRSTNQGLLQTSEAERDALTQSLIASCGLVRSGSICGLELYPGEFHGDDPVGQAAWFGTHGVTGAEVAAAVENRDLALDLYEQHCAP